MVGFDKGKDNDVRKGKSSDRDPETSVMESERRRQQTTTIKLIKSKLKDPIFNIVKRGNRVGGLTEIQERCLKLECRKFGLENES